MMSKRRGLGRGLDALIPGAGKPVSPEVQAGAVELSIDEISPNPNQPRQYFDETQLQELATSIEEHGLIQPLVVTKFDNGYRIIAGERRWRASRLAGLTTVPVIVKETTPQQMLELAIIENIQRADLNPLEEAQAYTQLMEEFGLTQEVAAERVGKSRAAVANKVRLLELAEAAKTALAAGELSEGHARAILGLKKEREQLEALSKIIKRGLTVRQTESLVRQMLSGDATAKPKRSPLSPNEEAMLSKFRSQLGTKVELTRSDEESGKLTIHFYSREELQAIFNAILGEDTKL